MSRWVPHVVGVSNELIAHQKSLEARMIVSSERFQFLCEANERAEHTAPEKQSKRKQAR